MNSHQLKSVDYLDKMILETGKSRKSGNLGQKQVCHFLHYDFFLFQKHVSISYKNINI